MMVMSWRGRGRKDLFIDFWGPRRTRTSPGKLFLTFTCCFEDVIFRHYCFALLEEGIHFTGTWAARSAWRVVNEEKSKDNRPGEFRVLLRAALLKDEGSETAFRTARPVNREGSYGFDVAE